MLTPSNFPVNSAEHKSYSTETEHQLEVVAEKKYAIRLSYFNRVLRIWRIECKRSRANSLNMIYSLQSLRAFGLDPFRREFVFLGPFCCICACQTQKFARLSIGANLWIYCGGCITREEKADNWIESSRKIYCFHPIAQLLGAMNILFKTTFQCIPNSFCINDIRKLVPYTLLKITYM